MDNPDYSPDDSFITHLPDHTPQGTDTFRQNDQIEISTISGTVQTSFDMRPPNSGLPFDPTQTNSFLPQISPTNAGLEQNSPDELSAISTVLMDQDFMQLDRVISFDDMMFTAQTIDDQGAPFSMNNNWTLG